MSLDPEPPELSASPALPVAEAEVAGQIAAHAAPGHGHDGPLHVHCENCGTRLEGPFCHRCGQHDFEFHRSFGHVFLEILENFLHFDAKLFRNTVTLLFRPGRLTAEFNAGKRASQMPPFRLYLFVSVLFFSLLFLEENAPPGETPGDKLKPDVEITVDGRAVSPLEALHRATQSGGQSQTGAEQKPAAEKQLRQERSARRWLAELAHRASDPAHQQEMVAELRHTLPKMLLFCLPLFALYTRVLFRKSGQVYLQHLVVALHFHTFIYLWLITRNGWVFVAGLPGWGLAPVLQFLCNLWLWIYPLVMLRHLFANSWPKTVLKTFLLLGVYFLTLTVVMLAGALTIFSLF